MLEKYDPKKHKSKLEVTPHRALEDGSIEFEITYKGEPYSVIVDKEDWYRILENNRVPQITMRRSGKSVKCVRVSDKSKPKKTNGSDYRSSRIHRWILGEENIPEGLQIDHINGNPLDNRKENLRVCTMMQNMVNRSSAHPVSKYNGVSYNKGKKRRVSTGSYRCTSRPWRTTITLEAGKDKVNLGTFATEEEAALAWDKVAYEHFGEFAKLNFPNT